MAGSSKKEVAALIAWAKKHGITYLGYDGSGHHVLEKDGSKAHVASTPGGVRSIPNARGVVRRTFDIKNDSPNHRKGRGRYGTDFDPEKARLEQERWHRKNDKRTPERAAALRAELAELKFRIVAVRSQIDDGKVSSAGWRQLDRLHAAFRERLAELESYE